MQKEEISKQGHTNTKATQRLSKGTQHSQQHSRHNMYTLPAMTKKNWYGLVAITPITKNKTILINCTKHATCANQGCMCREVSRQYILAYRFCIQILAYRFCCTCFVQWCWYPQLTLLLYHGIILPTNISQALLIKSWCFHISAYINHLT